MAQTYKPQADIPVGSSMRITVQFLDSNGVAFDPTSPTITVVDPSGTETVDTTPTRLSTGKYYMLIAAIAHGDWVAKGSGLLPDGSPVVTPDVLQRVSPTNVP
jgi:hypothetical protein